jgi:hypothetical protein
MLPPLQEPVGLHGLQDLAQPVVNCQAPRRAQCAWVRSAGMVVPKGRVLEAACAKAARR